jgi:hypothetical protein
MGLNDTRAFSSSTIRREGIAGSSTAPHYSSVPSAPTIGKVSLDSGDEDDDDSISPNVTGGFLNWMTAFTLLFIARATSLFLLV